MSEVDLEIVNPTLLPTQTSQNENFAFSSHQVQDTDKVYHKLLQSYAMRIRKKKASFFLI